MTIGTIQTQTRTRVHRLPEHLANQIAAGEVVERPASVVKELLENALDAGATRVELRIEGGGTTLIEVTDDGVGMSPEDARTSLERHATSKISSEADLQNIRTLGFRGEALPSIASVSRFSILTRRSDAVEGLRLEVEGGQVVVDESAGAPVGTTVRVADLFYNVPARKKFLRRPATEMGHITETVTRLALARPDVGFTLTHDGRRMLSAGAAQPLEERIVAALGKSVDGLLLSVGGASSSAAVRGYIAAPEVTKVSQAKGIHLFVNGRFVRDRRINHAVTRAYEGLVDRGRSPVAVLFLEVQPDEVDVNVHPQKTEVRFRDGRHLYDLVLGTLRRHLMSAPWVGGGAMGGEVAFGGPGARVTSYRMDPTGGGDAYADHRARVMEAIQRFGAGAGARAPSQTGFSGFTGRGVGAARDLAPGQGIAEDASGFFGQLEVIGQLRASFILCEGPEGLVVVDQHAAHERLEFERLRAVERGQSVAGQPLLVPVTLELAPAEAQALADHRETLASLGFDLEPLGGGTVAVREVPAALAERKIDAVIADLIEDLSATGETAAVEKAWDRLLATVACHSVVRAGDVLTRAECETLLARMDPVPFNANCPHGRPVAFKLDVGEIERRFGRR